MTVVAIHQPNYIPWLGFFDKMRRADVFILLDDAEYSTNNFTNRNRVKTHNGGLKWLTIPVSHSSKGKPINEAKVVPGDWPSSHFSTLDSLYRAAPFWSSHREFFASVYWSKRDRLVDYTIPIIRYMRDVFGLGTETRLSSSFGVRSKSTQRLVDLVKACGGDAYLSGAGSTEYLDEKLFTEDRIDVVHQDFAHPVYRQLHSPFVENLSAVDLLFNEGRWINGAG